MYTSGIDIVHKMMIMAIATAGDLCHPVQVGKYLVSCTSGERVMPVKSQSQRRLMYAVLEGKSDKVPKKVAKEYVDASHGLKDLPEKKSGPKRTHKGK